MKRLLFILFIAFCCATYSKADTALRRDTTSLEVVSFDTQTYNELKSNKKYNYYTVKVENNWWKRLEERINNWLRRNLKLDVSVKQTKAIMYSFFAIILILTIVFLYIYKPSLFYFNKKKRLSAYTIKDEDIEGVNFDELAQQAIDKEDYTEAIRYTYLKVLQTLNEKEYITFDPNKTANEYVYEIKRTELIPDFRELTNRFIYYRYGNGEANRSICESYITLSRQLLEHK